MSNNKITLDEVKKWTQVECQENIDEVLPMLIKELKSSSDASCLGIFELLCQSFIPCVPLPSLESTLFSKVLPHIEHVFVSLSTRVKSELENHQGTDVYSFKEIFEVLECLEKCLSQLTVYKQEILLEYLCSLPCTTLRISLQSFIALGWFVHIDTEDSLSENLSILFNKTSSVLKQFLNLWMTVKINISFEDDVQILVEVCTILNEICRTFRHVTGKHPVALWKAYVSTLMNYSNVIQERVDVALAVNLLCEDVHFNLSEIAALVTQYKTLEQEHEKSVSGLLQICGFYLKIIANLCEKFKFYLGNCFHSLLQLILTLYNYSGPSLSKPNLPENLVQEAERHLGTVIEPLLVKLLDESQFILLLSDQNLPLFQNEEYSFPLCCLYLFILENLSDVDSDLKMQLLDPSGHDTTNNSLIKRLFMLLPKCDIELSLSTVLPGVMCHGKPQRMISFYEYTCTHLCGIIAALPAEYFSLLEVILLEELFSDNFWRSLLACDVWAFLGRLERPNLCYHHCCILAKLVSHLDTPSLYSHWYIPFLFKRLFNFLAPEQQVDFVHQFPPAEYETIWIHLYGLCASNDVCSQQHLLEVLMNHSDKIEKAAFGKCEMDEVGKLLSDMTFSIRMISQVIRPSTSLNCSKIQELLHLCMSLWTFMPPNWDKNSEIDILVSELLLLTSLLIPSIENSHLLKLLIRLASLQCHGTDVIRISILKILSALGAKRLEPSPEQEEIFKLCALLLSNCLQEDCPVLICEGLATFSEFSHVTQNASIVRQCLQGKQQLLDMAKCFLNQVPLESSAKHRDTLSLLRAQAKCMKLKLVTPLSPPAKLPRLCCDDVAKSAAVEQSIREAVEEIGAGINKLRNAISSIPTPAWLCSTLKPLLTDLESILSS